MLTTATGAAAEERAGPNELAVPAPVEPKTEFPLVAILLSTFDGARFLREQLHSYLGQTWHNWRLYWRDDGSLDESVGLLDAFAAEAANGHCIRNGETAHLGAAGSFFALLRGALTGPAAFFAYSDQDDVWLPAKLSNGATALQAIPHHKPALYFCRRTRIDECGAPVGQQVTMPRRALGLNSALTQNLIPGCCMILNRAAAELVANSPMPDSTWHDWWSYIVVVSCDGVIIPGTSTDILYRQHSHNLVGEDCGYPGTRIRKWFNRRKSYYSLFWRHVTGLRDWNGPLSQQARTLLRVISQAQHRGLPGRISALSVSGLARQTPLETQIFRLGFLLS